MTAPLRSIPAFPNCFTAWSTGKGSRPPPWIINKSCPTTYKTKLSPLLLLSFQELAGKEKVWVSVNSPLSLWPCTTMHLFLPFSEHFTLADLRVKSKRWRHEQRGFTRQCSTPFHPVLFLCLWLQNSKGARYPFPTLEAPIIISGVATVV